MVDQQEGYVDGESVGSKCTFGKWWYLWWPYSLKKNILGEVHVNMLWFQVQFKSASSIHVKTKEVRFMIIKMSEFEICIIKWKHLLEWK